MQKKVGMIIVLIVVSLSGLVTLQSYLINDAMKLTEQTFRQNVLAAMSAASRQLEMAEAISSTTGGLSIIMGSDTAFCFTHDTVFDSAGQIIARSVIIKIDDSTTYEPTMIDGIISYDPSSPQKVMVRIVDPLGLQDSVILDTFMTPGEHHIQLDSNILYRDRFMYALKTDYASLIIRSEEDIKGPGVLPRKGGDGKLDFIDEIFAKLTIAESQPIDIRIDIDLLDSVIAHSLAAYGLDLDYAFGILSLPDDSLLIARPGDYDEQLKISELQSRLFPGDIFASPKNLTLFFPSHRTYLWQQVGPMLLATVIFMLIIIACFIYTVRTIIRQKRIAGLMIDFINNMTHEFKTPISTVALACEAIIRPDILSNNQKVHQYAEMIQNENRRMRNQTDKILQMAALEEGDYELQLSDVDLHRVIEAAVESARLLVNNRQGKITAELKADNHFIKADTVHMTNIIHNLLENANKYSENAPEITIATKNRDNGIIVVVTDRGIGIKSEDLKKIFDKYYRVPTGNIHNVKGFGIGLSYVRLMVTAHKGRITINSKPGDGTRVELFLPIITTDLE